MGYSGNIQKNEGFMYSVLNNCDGGDISKKELPVSRLTFGSHASDAIRCGVVWWRGAKKTLPKRELARRLEKEMNLFGPFLVKHFTSLIIIWNLNTDSFQLFVFLLAGIEWRTRRGQRSPACRPTRCRTCGRKPGHLWWSWSRDSR